MRLVLLPPLTVTLLVGLSSIASGQYVWPGYYGGYAATPGEGYAMGMAALVSSAGMATLATSKAASNFEDAVSKDIDNRVKFTQAYTERQRFVQSNREARRRKPPTSEQVYRWAQQSKPKPLSSRELDPVTGTIVWPVVLRDDAFRSFRESTQRFFHDAVAKPESFSYSSYQHLQQACDESLAQLKARINDYRANDYLQAKHFIVSLASAAQQL